MAKAGFGPAMFTAWVHVLKTCAFRQFRHLAESLTVTIFLV